MNEDEILWDIFTRPRELRDRTLAEMGHETRWTMSDSESKRQFRGMSAEERPRTWECSCGASGTYGRNRKIHEDWALTTG